MSLFLCPYVKEESYIQALLCNYLRVNYPDVVFVSDLSGVRLPIGLAKQVKSLKSTRGIPDLLILHPVGGYHGLLMELKTESAKLFKRDGTTLLADDHVAEQYAVVMRLRALGYAAFFVRGFASGRKLIEAYMNNRCSGAPVEYV